MNFPEPLDGNLTDAFDPVSLLRCQLDASEIERHGQVLTLNDAGRRLPELDFSQCILNGEDARRYLCIVGEADREEKQGDPLEFSTAVTLLKLGVHRVQRSSSSHFGHFAAQVRCCAARDGWPREVGE